MKNIGTFISKVIKISKRIILITLIIVAVIWIYKMIFTTNVSYDNLTRITNVKEMVRLNSLKVMDEFVYKDTIDNVGVVYNVKANIIIGFDLDSLKYKETDGGLEIELPNTNVISIYSEGEDLLDCYDITYGDLFGEPNINSKQWQIIRSNIKEYIKQEVINKGYVQIARKNALDNLTKLCHVLKGNVTVIDKERETSNIIWKEDNMNITY